jgi:tetratricopeptide (TPR) repeat protein
MSGIKELAQSMFEHLRPDVGEGIVQRLIGNLDESLQIRRDAIEAAPSDSTAWSEVGVVLLELGKLKEAKEAFNTAVLIEPTDEDAYYNLVLVLGLEGNIEKAIELVQEGLEWVSCRGKFRALTAKLEIESGNKRRGRELLDTLKPCEAEDYVYEFLIGDMWLRLNEPARAVLFLEEAGKKCPILWQIFFFLSLARFELGDVTNAISAAEQAVHVSMAVEPRKWLAGVHLRTGNLIEARNYAQSAVEMYPKNAECHDLLGQIYFAECAFEKAARCWERVVALEPNNSRFRSNFAECLRRLGKLDRALQECEEALELDPLNALAHNTMGSIYAHQNRVAEAGAEWWQAFELAPEDPLIQSNIGRIYYIRKNYDRAKEFFSLSISQSPDEPAPYLGLLSVSLLRDDRQSAENCLKHLKTRYGKSEVVSFAEENIRQYDEFGSGSSEFATDDKEDVLYGLGMASIVRFSLNRYVPR